MTRFDACQTDNQKVVNCEGKTCLEVYKTEAEQNQTENGTETSSLPRYPERYRRKKDFLMYDTIHENMDDCEPKIFQ